MGEHYVSGYYLDGIVMGEHYVNGYDSNGWTYGNGVNIMWVVM